MSDLIIGTNSSFNKFNSESKVSENVEVKKTPSQDTLSQVASSSENILSKAPSGDPFLPPPSKPPISLSQFLEILGNAKLNFKQAIQQTELLKFSKELQIPPSTDLSAQSRSISLTLDDIEGATDEVEARTNALMEKLTRTFNEINEVIEKQNEAINKLIEGNSQQQNQFDDLIEAHETYINGLEALGATNNGYGVYTIPGTPEAQAEYLRLTDEYQTSVDTFNQYWSTRTEEINQYNATTEAYNSKVTTINQQLTDNLGPYVEDVPQLQQVPLVIISAYEPIPSPQVPEPGQVYAPSLPDYFNRIASQSPTEIKTLQVPTFDRELIQKSIYNSLSHKILDPLNTQLNDQMDAYSFLLYLMQQENLKKESDPLLDRKIFSELLLPESSIHSKKKDINPGSMKSEDGNSHTNSAKILGIDILKLFMNDNYSDMQISDGSLSKLTLTSIGLLSKSSNEALISILRKLGASLAELPKDSSALTLLLTLSFSNHFLTQAKNGSLEQKISLQLTGISELNNLSPDAKKSLISILKTNQLLILGKFIDGHLGLTGFLDRLLIQTPLTQPSNLSNEVEQTNLQQLNTSTTLFTQKGFSEEKALFLAEMGSNALSTGWLMAPSVSRVSTALVNVPLLIDSVTASLIASPEQMLSLNECESIAETAVQTVLSEGIPRSAESFRKALQAELNEMGIYKLSAPASNRALLLPNPSLSSENYFQALLGSSLGKDGSQEFQNQANLLFKELSSTIINELKNLPVNIQEALFKNSMQNNPSLHSFLMTLSNPASVLSSSISSVEEIKISKNIYD